MKSQQTCPAFCSAACAAPLVARLFIILSPPHLFLDAGVFDELSEPLHGIRN